MWTRTHRSTGRSSGLGARSLAPILALTLVGLLPALVACNARTDRDVDQQTERAKENLDQAGNDLEQAGEQIGDSLERAGRETSKRLEEAGEQVQPYLADAEVTARVKTRLTAHPDLNPFQIDVDTVDGVVTLNGEVPTQDDHDAALEVARGTKGVVEVVDNLKIGVRGQ